MPTVCAIYGYEFTKCFEYRSMKFLPRYSWVVDVHDVARDLKGYNLTGVVLMDSYDSEQVFRLETVLSFIEQLDVLISTPQDLGEDSYFERFPPVARIAPRHDGGGAVLHQDTFFPDMRARFVTLAMSHLEDKVFCETTGWNTLFFKATIPFRQRKPYLEVSYFLLFSGLENYVRRTLKKPHENNVAALIARRLGQLGFNIYPDNLLDLKRSADSYARLRNALFHNSSFQTERRLKDGSIIRYDLRDYYAHFMLLVSLVVLKGIDFQHPRIRWDSWITLQN